MPEHVAEAAMENPEPLDALDAFLEGDEAAFAEVVRSWRSRLAAYARAFLDTPEDCQEAVQDAFLKLHQARRTIRENPRAWLFKVTRNRCLDLQRHAIRERKRTEGALPVFPGAALPPIERLEVREALGTLPERDRAVVCLKVLEGLSYEEIGEALGLTAGNVGYILHHALKKLASIIRPGGRS
jgi:RNA polymerase sigma-70 factor (ECF subfamily)